MTENLPDPEVAARGIQERPWSVTRGGLGGPNAVWLDIGNQGFRLHIEHDPEYPERGEWYEQKLRDAMTRLVTSCSSHEAPAPTKEERGTVSPEMAKALEATRSWQMTDQELHELEWGHRCPLCDTLGKRDGDRDPGKQL